MPIATFETPDGDEIEINSDDVIRIAPGDEDETAVVELDDGDELTVVALPRRAAAALGLNPRDVIDADEEEEEDDELAEEDDGYDD